ncbi:MAG: secretin N-terminal domain-containing protein [Vampirovibrionales bacterium]|nr:secretin N-terminal domain-containing protein [Vampirovibrionales bacterium]
MRHNLKPSSHIGNILRQGIWTPSISIAILCMLAINPVIIGQAAFAAPGQLPTLEQIAPTQSASVSRNSLPVKGQISIMRDVDIAPANKKVSLNMRDANIRDVLNILAKQGGFNVIMDESIDGTITVDINNISINKALEYVFTVSNFAYTKDGNTMIVATQEASEEKNLSSKTFKAIPVQYKNAADIAAQMNATIFSVNRPNGKKSAVVAFDGDSNSLLVMGSDSDLKLVGDFLRELDVPRNRRVYQIRHNTPLYVAQVIAANLFTPNPSGTFGDGATNAQANILNANGGGAGAGGVGAGGAGGVGGGAGGAGGVGGGAGGAGGGGAGGAGGAGGNIVITPPPITLSSGGVTLIADAVSSTLTVQATQEQMAMIDDLIEQVDVRRPQVAIEVSLVELSASDTKQLFTESNPIRFGSFQLAMPGSGSLTGATSFGFRGTPLPTSNPVPFNTFGLNYQNLQRRVKVLANPTLVAMDGQQSTISVTDQIATISNSVIQGAATTTATTITTTPVGIDLTVTPRIFNDGSVELTLTPTISSPGETVGDPATAQTTLISTRSVTINSARVQDGQTLVIGGLLNTNQNKNLNKTPGLGDIPVIGALFNQRDDRQLKTELVIVVTPHILKDEGVTYFRNPPQMGSHYNSPNQGSIQPVGLPKLIGDDPLQQNTQGNKPADPLKSSSHSPLPHPAQNPLDKIQAAQGEPAPKLETRQEQYGLQSPPSYGLPVFSNETLRTLRVPTSKNRLDLDLQEPDSSPPVKEHTSTVK